MKNRKKILIFLHKFPYPPKDSTKFRIFYSVILKLKEIFDLQFLIISWDTPKKEDIEFLEQFGNIKLFIYSKWRFIVNVILHCFSARPFQTEMFFFKEAAEVFKELLSKSDAAYVHTIRLAKYFENISPKIREKILLDYNDAISMHYLNGWKHYPFIFKLVIFIEGKKLNFYEGKILKILNNFSIVSEIDRNFILKNRASDNISSNFHITYTSVKINQEFYQNNALNSLDEDLNSNFYFTGNLRYYPNYDGISYFCRNIWPKIIEKFPNLKFYIIGSENKKLIKKFKNYPGLVFTGFVDNPNEIIAKSLAFISPVRIGAGIQGKVLESMGCGKVVISTSTGIEGIDGLKDKENILICQPNKAEKWIELISLLLQDKDLRKKIEINAEATIRKNFTIDKVGGKYLEIFKKIIKEN